MPLSSSLRPQSGFHFDYSTNISLPHIRPDCDLYLLHVFPPAIFVDKYELTLPFTLHGESDLELPLAAVGPVGSTLEVRLPPPLYEEMSVVIPLHARYPLPNASPYSTVRVPEPQGFWACPTPSTSKVNPFSHIPVPYVPSFDSDVWSITFFDKGEGYHEVQVPAGRPADAMFVEFGTVFAVLVAFFYVARAAWKTAARLRQRTDIKRE